MRRPIAGVLMASAMLASAPFAAAQDGKTIALTKELTSLLDRGKLDSVAARVQGSEDAFVAALYFPGSQLLVVSAKYAAPSLLREKIILKKYRDVYLDLNSATDPATRTVVEDLAADGLHAQREAGDPFDFYTKGTNPRVPFDGQWKKHKLSEEEYMKAFSEADADYARMLEALISQLKQSAS
jgi:hypothetical protein